MTVYDETEFKKFCEENDRHFYTCEICKRDFCIGRQVEPFVCNSCKRKNKYDKNNDCANCKHLYLSAMPELWEIDLYCKKSKRFIDRKENQWTCPPWCLGFKKSKKAVVEYVKNEEIKAQKEML